MRLRTLFASLAILIFGTSVAFADTGFNQVKPSEFDPGKTFLVQAAWLDGIGCPTNATTAIPNASFTGVAGKGSYTDPTCTSGDPNDKRNEGLLLAKTGPTTTNFASATAELKGVKGMTLTELGYDLRKSGGSGASALGSHCGAGAPRFDIETTKAFYFLGCNSPPGTVTSSSTGWIRLRWGGSAGALMAFNAETFVLENVIGDVKRITIVFDEGTDASGAPDMFGLAVLDNVDVNGTLVGRGGSAGDGDRNNQDNGKGDGQGDRD